MRIYCPISLSAFIRPRDVIVISHYSRKILFPQQGTDWGREAMKRVVAARRNMGGGNETIC